jgi:TolB protein
VALRRAAASGVVAMAVAVPTAVASLGACAAVTHPDGRVAFVAVADGRRQLHVAGADGSWVRRLLTSGADDVNPALSPDGRRIAFTRQDHGRWDQFAVCTIRIDGTGLVQVTPNDINAGEPVWSPDGALIAFQSPPDDEGLQKNLYTIGPTGGHITPLTANLPGADSDGPTWSPDGRRLMFAHVPPGGSAGSDLYVVDRDGSRPHAVLRNTVPGTAGEASQPSWGR